MARVGDFKDRHKGERIVVAGNGESLNQLKLTRIDCPSFGVNRIFLHPTWRPTYYCAESKKLCRTTPDLIRRYAGPKFKFIANRCREFFGEKKLVYRPEMKQFVWINMPNKPVRPADFSTDCHRVVHHGMNVVYMALQLALYMGTSQVILIGVDFDYDDGQVAAKHFYPNKLQKDTPLDSSHKDITLAHYREAHRLFNSDPDAPRIVNATPGTKLGVFPKADFNELF